MVSRKKVVRIALAVILLLIVLPVLFFLSMPRANAAESTPWDKWGVAPYARNLNEACKKAPTAISGFNMPQTVKEHFIEKLGAVCKSDKGVWLTPDMPLEQMWSGPDSHHKEPHVMDKKRVGELPVLRSPDGRPYSKGSVAETAYAFSWTFVYEGKTYVLYLPLVCFNWSWTFGPPVAPLEQCRRVEYTVKIGDGMRFAVLARKRLPSSACWQLCDGDMCSALPSPCDTCDWIGPKSVIPAGFEPLHSGKYVARSEHQVLVFPSDVMFSYVVLCDERAGLGESDSWIVQPSAWSAGVTTVVVPYGGQPWPAWGQVDMSKWPSR